MSPDVRTPMPPQGWPPAPCRRWRVVHPAHSWSGRVSGKTYWCGPSARSAAHALMDLKETGPEEDR